MLTSEIKFAKFCNAFKPIRCSKTLLSIVNQSSTVVNTNKKPFTVLQSYLELTPKEDWLNFLFTTKTKDYLSF